MMTDEPLPGFTPDGVPPDELYDRFLAMVEAAGPDGIRRDVVMGKLGVDDCNVGGAPHPLVQRGLIDERLVMGSDAPDALLWAPERFHPAS